MRKLIIIGLVAAAAWAGSVIRSEGTDKVFGGIFAPVESVREGESSAALALTPAAQVGDVPSQPRIDAGRVVGGVRDRLGQSSGARR